MTSKSPESPAEQEAAAETRPVAATDAIVETDVPVALPRNDGLVRVVEQTPNIPEGEPKVDTAEVDMVDWNNNLKMSVPMSVPTIARQNDDERPTSYSPHASHSTTIPNENQVAAAGAAVDVSIGSSDDPPDFKAQVMGRYFPMAGAEAETRRCEEENSGGVAAATLFAPDQAAATANASFRELSNQSRNVPSPSNVDTDPVEFKDQTQNAFSRESGNNMTGSGHHDDYHIPVADAVLISASLLFSEESERNQQQSQPGNQHSERGNERGSTEGSSLNIISSSKGSDGVRQPVSEHRFWATVIFAAMFLNTLLVAAAVVGGFCAAGKCKSGGSSSASSGVGQGGGGGAVKTLAPLSPPSHHPSDTPSATPSSEPLKASLGTFPPTSTAGSVHPTLFPGPSVSPHPTRVPIPTVSPHRVPIIRTAPPAPVPSAVPQLNASRPATAMPMSSPVLSTPIPTAQGAGSNTGGSGLPVGALVAIVVGFEVIIVAGLVMYYRRWKKQRELFSKALSDPVEQTNLNGETGDNAETFEC